MFINTNNLTKKEFEKVIKKELVPELEKLENEEDFYICCIINDDLDMHVATRCDECSGLKGIEGFGYVFTIPKEVKKKFEDLGDLVAYIEELTGFDTFDCSYQDNCSCEGGDAYEEDLSFEEDNSYEY